mmetsp:Transcript_118545/g.204944  ORF Transcript_118545/g.204944 Transcript_118545/m.204944 type:complete len:141 (+) Transcript_118545:2-424(+)
MIARQPPLHMMPNLPQVHVVHLPGDGSHREADVSFNNLLKFFGLKSPHSGSPVVRQHPDEPAEAPVHPFQGLFSHFLETPGPLQSDQRSHQHGSLKELFDIHDFKPVPPKTEPNDQPKPVSPEPVPPEGIDQPKPEPNDR